MPCYKNKLVHWSLILSPNRIKKVRGKDGLISLDLTLYQDDDPEQVGNNVYDKIDPKILCSVQLTDYPDLIFVKQPIYVGVIGTIVEIKGINQEIYSQNVVLSNTKLELPDLQKKK